MPLRKDFKSVSGLFKRFLRPYWGVILFLTVINILLGIFLSLRPLVIAPALEAFAGKKPKAAEQLSELTLNNLGATLIQTLHLDIENILDIGFLVAGLFVLFSVCIAGLNFSSLVLSTRTRSMISRDMMVSLHEHMLTLPLAFFQKRRAGELLSRLTNDVSKTAAFLDSFIRGLLQSLAQVTISLYILFRTDALFTFTVIGLGSIHMVVTRLLGEKVKRKAQGVTDKMGILNANLFESFLGIRLIKSFAAEKFDSEKITSAATKYRKFETRYLITKRTEEPLRILTDALVIGIVLILVFYAVIQGRLSLPASLMFFYLSQQLLAPVSNIASQFLGLQNMIGSAAAVTDIFNTQSTIPEGTRKADKLKERIEVKGVDFAYEKNNPVLKNIHLAINRGEMVALVGPSGSGKSTLADLILRFYEVEKGTITYDGRDIREFTQESYRNNFGVVSQESLLFNATIRENIIYNRPLNDEDLSHAVWAANAEEFITALPEGLSTLVGDRGIRLSGGQKQRVAIARAVYGRPSILLLDEATSALDSESERAVQEAINRILKNMTALVIAHRLSTVTHADKIVVLTGGEIEAIGPHQTVYEKSPTYRRLYNIQFESGGSNGFQ
ncbi:MAG: ABC transporter ATP-binding protein [Deltaproteobacteria bacterium]|nr:ABC transporter ATP-binding protein [Deltaproteobacteria bacterium]